MISPVGLEIIKQIGNSALMMLRAHKMNMDEFSVTFSIAGSKKCDQIKVYLNGWDLYEVSFFLNNIEIEKVEGVYNDMLTEILEEYTGVSTNMIVN